LEDFYKTLGVEKTATKAELKKAFRKLARQYHPDANPDNKDAEAKFKEINQAYEILSNDEKRKAYDAGPQYFGGGPGGGRGGQGAYGGFDPSMFEEMFARQQAGGRGRGAGGAQFNIFDLFGGGGPGGAGAATAERGADLTYVLNLSFDDALRGVTTKISVDKNVTCPVCRGTGSEPGTAPVTCPECQGRGVIAQNQGFFALSQVCPRCLGAGSIIEHPCHRCRGEGQVRATKKYTVKIPPGVKNGSKIRLKGKGQLSPRGGPPGDLYVKVQVAESPLFHRKGDDLMLTVPVSVTEAALGAKIEVPTTNGSISLKIPKGTQNGRNLRVKGKGAPHMKGSGNGDLLVKVKVEVPTGLTKEEKELLEKFASLRQEDLRSGLKAR
jgi:molecular chaperone DnaJ